MSVTLITIRLSVPLPVLDVQRPGLLVDHPGPGGGADQQQERGREAGHDGLVGRALQANLTTMT